MRRSKYGMPKRRAIIAYTVAGLLIGELFAVLEYVARVDTEDAQAFVPLAIRAGLLGLLLVWSAVALEALLKGQFKHKRFGYIVTMRAVLYTLVISFWLVVVNSVWISIGYGVSLPEAAVGYLSDFSFRVNLPTVFIALLLFQTVQQINSLHRKGELLQFILGRYYTPREIDRIFCFIDLKDSTTIAEKLGHLQFGLFLKDYYADITEAIRQTKGEIYQYVGDEIILSWPIRKGLERNNAVRCFFLMQEIIETLKERYLRKYGFFPRFKAGIHGGPVIVTWVGELKREIMYLGDVVNTAARIQERCKHLGKDCLISETILERLEDRDSITAVFMEETQPRGKEQAVRLYSIESIASDS
ncbi:MAG: adenylate/guanylate cyclase domain-containing protein [Saprospiraceae bacterium]|nr:adenylate/guanylate cyclase domain-containing protein [Saprospiraceae bacterium]